MRNKVKRPKKTLVNIFRVMLLLPIALTRFIINVIAKSLVRIFEIIEKVLSIIVLFMLSIVDYCLDSVALVIGGEVHIWLKQDNED